MKKPKTLETKLRSAIRLIWSRSSERRAILTAAKQENPKDGSIGFICPICKHFWPIWAAEVDHEPPIGTLDNWQEVGEFIRKMFYGPQQAVCKECHKLKTAAQRRKRIK